jgi:predicted nuclease of restriction endonuclease-like RecB superfamily
VLTANLARSRTSEGAITPLFIDVDDQRYQDTAEELIQIFQEHLGEPKGKLEDTIDQLTIADTDYKIVQGLAKLLKDECEFETVAPVEPREIRQALFEKANDSYPIVRQPTLGEDTQKLAVYSSVADTLGITLEECYRGMYADLEENKRLVRFGHRVSDEYDQGNESTTTTRLTGDSEESYAEDTITVNWLLTRYNLALAQAVLYDATEMRVRVWDSFATVFSYVKLFGLMHRIYPMYVFTPMTQQRVQPELVRSSRCFERFA